ncbi:hypothetical protein K505DRAFT_360752 [Melanomma pulvis-pyrius CBS 109.77]|uniref:Uncharacterized protein n=1 Tax=Melanomma pulvis-pyrius CBS 109.77 TaxID=1314802 RepID=A0A6A6XDZ1_9PLEO|nr:hypothetical protein K505DRAFT_360752 [Melanomma pulvis-pyrius CBS 109.77]
MLAPNWNTRDDSPGIRDPLMGLVVDYINTLNTSSFLHYLINLGVQTHDTTLVLWPSAQPRHVKLYTFKITGRFERRQTVSVRVVADAHKLEIDSFEVNYKSNWIPLKTFIDSPPILTDTSLNWAKYREEKGGYVWQYNWWQNNGRHFRLLDLPEELRRQIFIQVLGPEVYPQKKRGSGHNEKDIKPMVLRQGCTYEYLDRDTARATEDIIPYRESKPNRAIFYLNKQVLREARRAGWEGTLKCFKYYQDFPHYDGSLDRHSSGAGGNMDSYGMLSFNYLNRVSLNLGNDGYFALFGLNCQPFRLENEYPNPRFLEIMKSTQYLELCFRNPFEGWSNDPWCTLHDAMDLPAKDRGSCQKIIVDWILTFAKPYIEHIPKIELTGFIKHSTKGKWDTIFEEQRTKKVYYEMANEREDILSNAGRKKGPECLCKKTCISACRHVSQVGEFSAVELQRFDFEG